MYTSLFQVNEFHSVLHLQLQQVPPFTENGSAKSSKGGNSDNGDEDNDDNVSEIILNNDGKISLNILECHFKLS